MSFSRIDRLGLVFGLFLYAGATSAATFTVDILADDADAADANPGDGICADNFNACTLRAAIMEANESSGDDTIEFDVSGTLVLFAGLGALPEITEFLIIDGTTASGFNSSGQTLDQAPPVMIIDGNALSGTNDHGLTFSGSAAADSQVLSLGIQNFPGDGINVSSGTDGLVIQGCVVDSNGGAGMLVLNPDFMVIGRLYNFLTSSFQGLGNQFTNNDGDGISLFGSNSNQIYGNYLGMEADGSTPGGNGGNGLTVVGSENLIGFFDSNEQAGNIASNNSAQGISASGTDNSLFANRVGTGATVGFYGNGAEGIRVTGRRVRVGADEPNAANIVINNTIGIRAGTATVSANDAQIVGNRVGVVEGLGNAGDGIRVENATGVIVRGNQVVNNAEVGIRTFPDVPGVILQGNEIGVIGNLPRGNAGDGLWIRGPDAVIGGDEVGQGNVIGDNGSSSPPFAHGIRVSGDGAQIIGNFIGTTASGADVGQPERGIELQASQSTIARNVIGNNSTGIDVVGNSHTIEENWIGTNANGARLGHEFDGISLSGVSDGIGSFIGPRNTIAFNGRFGIGAFTAPGISTPYSVFFNEILHNENAGFFGPLDSGAGIYSLRFNEFGNNGNAGVRISNDGTEATLVVNYFYGNAGLGFDLFPTGPDPIDPGDPDEGPNRRMNAPEILDVEYFRDISGIPTISFDYRVDATPGNAAYPLTVYAFWTERREENEGRHFINSFEYATPQAVQTTVHDILTAGVPVLLTTGGSLILMVNDAEGNSSEYSAPFEFGEIELFFRDGFEAFDTRF